MTTAASASVTQTFGISTDSVSNTLQIADLCGAFIYSIQEDYSFLAVDSDTRTITLTLDSSKEGIYQATLLGKLVNYPAVPPATMTFTAVVNPCFDTTLSLLASINDMSYEIKAVRYSQTIGFRVVKTPLFDCGTLEYEYVSSPVPA